MRINLIRRKNTYVLGGGFAARPRRGMFYVFFFLHTRFRITQ